MGDKFTFGIRNGQKPRRPATGRSSHVRAAAARGIEWTLTDEEYASASADGVCFYCKGWITTGGCGLDRMDSLRGYVPGNVVACCYRCNIEKGATLAFDEYCLVWALRRKRAKPSMPSGGRRADYRRAVVEARRDAEILEAAREAAPNNRLQPGSPCAEWRRLLNERADKRACGLDVEAPWPDLPVCGERFLAWRERLGITQRQAAHLLTVRGVAKCSYRSVQRLETTGATWQDGHAIMLSD